ncbi:hypothetical protein chiPu_0034032, partial [Chiloscyllium punctatum]|nr:hypothetical protein [Chiloscyllium punctatum]
VVSQQLRGKAGGVLLQHIGMVLPSATLGPHLEVSTRGFTLRVEQASGTGRWERVSVSGPRIRRMDGEQHEGIGTTFEEEQSFVKQCCSERLERTGGVRREKWQTDFYIKDWPITERHSGAQRPNGLLLT